MSNSSPVSDSKELIDLRNKHKDCVYALENDVELYLTDVRKDVKAYFDKLDTSDQNKERLYYDAMAHMICAFAHEAMQDEHVFAQVFDVLNKDGDPTVNPNKSFFIVGKTE